jgi:hypothetical protein
VVVRMYGAIVGLAAILGTLSALSLPIHLDVMDGTAHPMACGSAFHPSYLESDAADRFNRQLHDHNNALFEPSSYSVECASRVQNRRIAALAVGLAGGVIIAGSMFWHRRDLDDLQPTGPSHDVGYAFN